MKPPKLTIGLTGGIGSGKTAASDWFATQGIQVVDADVVARQIVAPHQPALQEIVQTFGAHMLLDDGSLNRAAMRAHVFAHPDARAQLEAITHPRIRQTMIEQLHTAPSPYVLLVSPLLLETSQHELVDRVLLIDVDEAVQLQRASLRDGQSPEAIGKIMAAQMPRHERHHRAHDVVNNSGYLADLHHQLGHLHQQYLQHAQQFRR
jgi:dephospho-CoA kinase